MVVRGRLAQTSWLLLGVVLLGAVQPVPADVITEILHSVGTQPGAPELERSLQDILKTDFAAGRYATALERLAALARGHAENPLVWFVLGGVQIQRQAWDEAIVAADQCLKAKPDWPQGLWLKAYALMSAGKRREAAVLFDRAIAVAPGEQAGYVQRGSFLLHQATPTTTDLRNALADFERAKKQGAPAGLVLALVGQTYHKLKDAAQAESAFRQALHDDPAEVTALTELVRIADAAGRSAEATRWIEGAAATLASRPDDVEMRSQLALVQARHALSTRGRPSLVEAAFREAVVLEPSHTLARSEFAQWLDQQGRTREAIPILRDGLRQPPFDADLAANLAWALAESGTGAELVDARRWLRVAQEKEPESPYLADTAAWIEHRAGDNRKALEAIGPALSLVGQVPEVAYHAAAIHAGLGRRDEALRYLRQALEGNQSFPGEANARKLLRQIGGTGR